MTAKQAPGIKAPDGSDYVTIVDGAGSLVSVGGGVQYTEGDTDATITGTAILWEDAANTLTTVNASKGLPVNIVAGSSSGTEYTEDAAAAANPVGGMLIVRRKDTLSATEVSADGDNIAVNATSKGELYVKQTDAVALAAGSALIGSAGIDQTTAGTTNAISLKYLNTTAVDTNSGNKSAGTLRVVLATDQPALTNKLLVTPDANSAVNVAQINGVTVLMGNGTTGTGSQRVTIASDNTPFKVDHSATGIAHGVTTVTTAGTDVALAGSTAAKWVIIQSQTDNTSLIAVGATGVDATIATGNGIILYPGDSITLPVDNLADVFIDSLVNGEGVRYTYGT